MILKSPAKLNLFLNIVSKRDDGYHNIETYFQFVNLYDQITIQEIGGKEIKFNTNSRTLLGSDNLCLKAALILKDYIKKKSLPAVSIDLEKKIPIGGGLGGGSSNAASVLLGLNKMWDCNLEKDELIKLGSKLGSDVPVFVNGFSAYAEGTGNKLIKYDFEKKYFLIIDPGIQVSSKIMYEKFKIKDCIKRINLDNMHQNIGFNSFESLLCENYSEIRKILDILRNHDNGYVSGSGGCIFSIFDTESQAINVLKNIPNKYQTYIVHSLKKI